MEPGLGGPGRDYRRGITSVASAELDRNESEGRGQLFAHTETESSLQRFAERAGPPPARSPARRQRSRRHAKKTARTSQTPLKHSGYPSVTHFALGVNIRSKRPHAVSQSNSLHLTYDVGISHRCRERREQA